MPLRTAAARRAEAPKPKKMALHKAFQESAAFEKVRLAGPEKYTTECIEGVGAAA